MTSYSVHPIEHARPLLEKVWKHCSKAHPNSGLNPLLRDLLESPDPGRHTLLLEYIMILPKLNWEEVPCDILLAPLTKLPYLHSAAGRIISFSSLWPLQLAANGVEAGMHVQFEAPAGPGRTEAADVFMCPNGEPHRGYQHTSYSTNNEGQKTWGVAFECKALASENSLESEGLSEPSRQLTFHGGGFAAIDISAIVLKKISSENWSGHNAFLKLVAAHHETLHLQLLAQWKKRNYSGLAGFLTHCRVQCDPIVTQPNKDFQNYVEYREPILVVDPNYRLPLPTRSRLDAQGFGDFLLHMIPNGTTRIGFSPIDGKIVQLYNDKWTTVVIGIEGGESAVYDGAVTEEQLQQLYGKTTKKPT